MTDQHWQTFLRAIRRVLAWKPRAGKSHAGICEGAPSNRCPYLDISLRDVALLPLPQFAPTPPSFLAQ